MKPIHIYKCNGLWWVKSPFFVSESFYRPPAFAAFYGWGKTVKEAWFMAQSRMDAYHAWNRK